MTHRSTLLLVAALLALGSLACSFTINIPSTSIETGETETTDIDVDVPDVSGTINLDIEFGAGELNITPGAEDALVSGTATYNVVEFAPVIEESGRNVTVTMNSEDVNFDAVPNFDNVENTWDLELASDVEMELGISAGAYEGDIELGGMSIERMRYSGGASDARLSFSEPNLVAMERLTIEAGASSLVVSGLANTRAERIDFSGGAGDFTLEFSGELDEDMEVNVSAGVGSVTIIVPEGVSAELHLDSALAGADLDDGWSSEGGVYYNSGDGPKITFNVDLALGSLTLRND